jgi:hypothetical protein
MTRPKFLSFCLTLSLILSGCAARQKQVTNLPAGVTQAQVQKWDSAVASFDKIAQTVSTLRQAVIALNQTTVTDSSGTHKVLPDGSTYVAILTSIGKIDQAEIDASALLKALPNTWSETTQLKVNSYAAIIQQELQNITAQQLAGIKSASAQAQVQQLITELGGLATLILQL